MAAMGNRVVRKSTALAWVLITNLIAFAGSAAGSSLPDTVARIKTSVVGVGTFLKTRSPPAQLLGTGFVVADGRHVLTNAHVLSTELTAPETLVVFVGGGAEPVPRLAVKVAEDAEHDLLLLKMSEAPLPALQLGDSDKVREGETYAFTGFPIGAILGLYPATHHAMISAITPLAVPLSAAKQLTPAVMRRLKHNYAVFQLDGTAYPGNSGSPLYDPASGTVVGVVNKVFVQESRESVLQKPSGISYAVPINFARELLHSAELTAGKP